MLNRPPLQCVTPDQCATFTLTLQFEHRGTFYFCSSLVRNIGSAGSSQCANAPVSVRIKIPAFMSTHSSAGNAGYRNTPSPHRFTALAHRVFGVTGCCSAI